MVMGCDYMIAASKAREITEESSDYTYDWKIEAIGNGIMASAKQGKSEYVIPFSTSARIQTYLQNKGYELIINNAEAGNEEITVSW